MSGSAVILSQNWQATSARPGFHFCQERVFFFSLLRSGGSWVTLYFPFRTGCAFADGQWVGETENLLHPVPRVKVCGRFDSPHIVTACALVVLRYLTLLAA